MTNKIKVRINMKNIILSELNYAECARYLGYGENTPDETIYKIMGDSEALIKAQAIPRFVYKIFDIQTTEKGILLLGTNLALMGNSIKEHLDGCDKAILLCATLSEQVDRLIRRTQLKDMAHALIMDSMASVAIEQVCEKAEEIIKAEYLAEFEKGYFTWRFGFGYGDLPLSQEVDALNLLNAEKTIGVNISDSYIMFPRKTVACIMGISETEITSTKRGCISCNMKDRCKYRLRGERCGF